MKKILAAVIAVSCIALTACSGGNTAENTAEETTTAAETTVSVSEETEAPIETAEPEPPAPLEGEQVAYSESNIGKYISKVSGMNVYTMTLTLTQESGSMTINMTSDGERVGARAFDDTSDMSLICDGGLIYTYDHGSKSGIITKDDGTLAVVTPQTYFGAELGDLLSENMAVTTQTADGKTYTVESSYIGGDANDIIRYWFDESGEFVKFVETYSYDNTSSTVTAEVLSLSDTHDESIFGKYEDYEMADFTDPDAFTSQPEEEAPSEDEELTENSVEE